MLRLTRRTRVDGADAFASWLIHPGCSLPHMRKPTCTGSCRPLRAIQRQLSSLPASGYSRTVVMLCTTPCIFSSEGRTRAAGTIAQMEACSVSSVIEAQVSLFGFLTCFLNNASSSVVITACSE